MNTPVRPVLACDIYNKHSYFQELCNSIFINMMRFCKEIHVQMGKGGQVLKNNH